MWRILASEFLKLRRTWLVYLALLAPLGLIGMAGTAYAMNYGPLVTTDHDRWLSMVSLMHMLTVVSILLGSGVIASIFLGMEHQGHTWKQLMALPISRFQLLVGKFLWLAILLAGSSLVLAVGYVVLGTLLAFEGPIPWQLILTECFAPYLAALAVLALQVWLSSVFQNQAMPVMASVVGVLVCGSASVLSRWLPWIYPQLATPLKMTADDPAPWFYALLGVGVGCAFLILGASHFSKREVK